MVDRGGIRRLCGNPAPGRAHRHLRELYPAFAPVAEPVGVELHPRPRTEIPASTHQPGLNAGLMPARSSNGPAEAVAALKCVHM